MYKAPFLLRFATEADRVALVNLLNNNGLEFSIDGIAVTVVSADLAKAEESTASVADLHPTTPAAEASTEQHAEAASLTEESSQA